MMLGSSYPKYRHQVAADVERLSSVVHLIYEESTKLNLMPAKIAATLRLPVWRRFTSAVDNTLTLGMLKVYYKEKSAGIFLKLEL